MAQPPSEHDGDAGSLDDFAVEQPVVQARHADVESVVLWVTDRWREPRIRSWFVGTLVLLVVGGAGLAWWLPTRSVAPPETSVEPIISSRVEGQPIESPAIVPGLPASSDSDWPVSVARGPSAIAKSQFAPGVPSAGAVAERKSSAASSPADLSHVSPEMPRPATSSASSPLLPTQTIEEELPPSRAVVSGPAAAPPEASAAPPSSSAATAQGSSRSGAEDTENVAIQDVLGRYRAAYAALDVAGVHQVWPAVNQRSLERAFRQLEGQDVFFFSCNVSIDGSRAEAVCVGTTNFIPKIGNRSPQSGPSQWNFKLSKGSAGGWLIDDAQAR